MKGNEDNQPSTPSTQPSSAPPMSDSQKKFLTRKFIFSRKISFVLMILFFLFLSSAAYSYIHLRTPAQGKNEAPNAATEPTIAIDVKTEGLRARILDDQNLILWAKGNEVYHMHIPTEKITLIQKVYDENDYRGWVDDFSISPNGKHIAFSEAFFTGPGKSEQHSYKLYNTETGETTIIDEIPPCSGGCYMGFSIITQWSQDSQKAMYSHNSGENAVTKIYNLNTKAKSSVSDLAWGIIYMNDTTAVYLDGEKLNAINIATQQNSEVFSLPEREYGRIIYEPSTKQLLVESSSSSTLYILDIADYTVKHTISFKNAGRVQWDSGSRYIGILHSLQEPNNQVVSFIDTKDNYKFITFNLTGNSAYGYNSDRYNFSPSNRYVQYVDLIYDLSNNETLPILDICRHSGGGPISITDEAIWSSNEELLAYESCTDDSPERVWKIHNINEATSIAVTGEIIHNLSNTSWLMLEGQSLKAIDNLGKEIKTYNLSTSPVF